MCVHNQQRTVTYRMGLLGRVKQRKEEKQNKGTQLYGDGWKLDFWW